MKQTITFPQSTRTAKEAAAELGCKVEQIAKSIIFRTESGKAVLVVTRGDRQVNLVQMGDLVGERLEKADADFVKVKSGFVIGSVPPYGHKQSIETYIDNELENLGSIWASAGTTNSVYKTTWKELLKDTKGVIFSSSK